MRLVLDIPESWSSARKSNGVLYTVEPGMTVFVPDMIDMPEDIWYWSQGAAERDLPKGAVKMEITNRFDRQTPLDWPTANYESTAFAADGRPVEFRLHTVFAMIEHGTIVASCASTADKLANHRDEILKMIDSARPDWGDDPRACLVDLLKA